MIKDKDININITLDKNSFIYYKIFILPILEDVKLYYYKLNNPYLSFERFKINTNSLYEIIIYNQNKDFKKICNKILLDIFDFLTCDFPEFYNYKHIIENDLTIIISHINIFYNNSFINTLSIIFYFIILFKKSSFSF